METTINIAGRSLRVIKTNTVVLGSGAAGYNAADRLWQFGQKDIVIVTENRLGGTSRNTGSDKQTYYKLSLSGDDPDSVRAMAETFFSGHCVDGDLALCEAALSAQSFLRLVEFGVPFPQSRYGEFVGYKTDHDPRHRATSAGPYTSKLMTECLETAVLNKGITVCDGFQAIRILVDAGKVIGLLLLNLKAANEDDRFVAINCRNLIFAAGGPGGIYADSVYPEGHFGASGLAFEAGVKGINLTEWQYGLSSVRPRWNVSGTYMQVMPRFVSTAEDGSDERDFLSDFFLDRNQMLSMIFLKGYQWPFDVRKVSDGSSVIDLLVYRERFTKGRRVFLDFTRNPDDQEIDFAELDAEAYAYLSKAGACFGTPLERLAHMNRPAVDLYLEKGVNLAEEKLEIALCVQHNNGGLAVDCWWQTNIDGIFAAGEAAGTHGVYRPGGSALNAGQVGSTRAAMFIAAHGSEEPRSNDHFRQVAQDGIAEVLQLVSSMPDGQKGVSEALEAATNRMSRAGAAIRRKNDIVKAIQEVGQDVREFCERVRASYPEEASAFFRLRELLIAQHVYLKAMADYIERGGKSRGSALYMDVAGEPAGPLSDQFRFTLDDGSLKAYAQEVTYIHGVCETSWRSVRPLPATDDFFENVWRDYRNQKHLK